MCFHQFLKSTFTDILLFLIPLLHHVSLKDVFFFLSETSIDALLKWILKVQWPAGSELVVL